LDWQLKAEVSSIVTQKANRSNSFETQDSWYSVFGRIWYNHQQRLRFLDYGKIKWVSEWADLCGRAVLQPLDLWGRVFESRWWHARSSLLFVVCCIGSGLCDGLITRSEESYRVCVSVWSVKFNNEAD
jgi:hypothetical protein